MSLRTHAQTCDRTAVCQRPRRTGRCSAQITPCPDGSSSGAGLGQESRRPLANLEAATRDFGRRNLIRLRARLYGQPRRLPPSRNFQDRLLVHPHRRGLPGCRPRVVAVHGSWPQKRLQRSARRSEEACRSQKKHWLCELRAGRRSARGTSRQPIPESARNSNRRCAR